MIKWNIAKSAGDDVSFVAVESSDGKGMTYKYACNLAKKLTAAMKLIVSIASASESKWGYDHPEREMIRLVQKVASMEPHE